MKKSSKDKLVRHMLVSTTVVVLGLTGWVWYSSQESTHRDSITKSLQANGKSQSSKDPIKPSIPGSPKEKMTTDLRQTWIDKGSRVEPAKLAMESRRLSAGVGKSSDVINQAYSLFTYDPRQFFAVEREIGDIHDKAGSESIGRLLQVLALVEGTEAQQVLLEVANKYRDNEFLSKNVIYALHEVAAPSQELVDLTFSHIDQPLSAATADMAVLSLGSIVANARESRSPVYNNVVHKLQDIYNAGDRFHDLAVSAMGNSADQVFLPLLQKSVVSSSIDERVNAAVSLRFYSEASVYQDLAKLLKDAHSNVRRAALDSLRFHSSDIQALDLALDHLHSEPDDSNRIVALSIAAANRHLNPDRVAMVLQKAAASDPSAEVRKSSLQLSRSQGS